MLIILTKHTLIIIRRLEETLGSDEYVNGLDGGDGFTAVPLSPNSLSYTH